MTDFRSVPGFVDTDPFDSAFWNPDHAKDDDMLANAWNYYGNSWIWLKKGSPYEVPGGRLLIPLYEKDAWMKDYLGYLSAYQHEIHCVGVIKHALDQCGNGNVSDATLKHANTHCLEVVRHSVMCQPDLKLDVPYYDSHGVQHDPYWGNGKHMCRDPKKVHEFLASRNMGFKVVRENGVDVLKAWAWPLPTDVAIDAAL
ncbi:hypothetical protein K491DRAFT_686930 [Lophiostoma macrostomum CBS 122681]|uniref:Uncharacterized protein n=1 Tax=Lophiostoma macrostomum CBS 122681 TaxID=1314788 RepID=A0A6A6TR85_9PLEO|nr:hypothetical protein K491DRAFT_686930 [Lophiostoma macrostomum CBS 122681]